MKRLAPFHHYNLAVHEITDPVERVEERVVQLLLRATITDDSRDSSVAFELKHSSGVLQFGRLLAKRRDLPPRSSAVGALVHDIYVIVHGRYKDHAHLGAPIARVLLEDVGGFSEEEVHEVETIVFHHSDKHIFSDDGLAELGKDADVLDSFLYPGAFDYYLLAKPLEGFVHYLTRAKRVWQELSLPIEPAFSILDTYDSTGWLVKRARLSSSASTTSVNATSPFAILLQGSIPELCIPASATVTDELRALADGAITEARSSGCAAADVLLVWPAIDRWEPLHWDTDQRRLSDIGITGLDANA